MSVYKTIVNIILLIVYVFLFGQQSIIKFFDNAVIVTEDMEHPASIIPPGILTVSISTIYLSSKQSS